MFRRAKVRGACFLRQPGVDHLVIAWTVNLDYSLSNHAGFVFVTDPDRLADLECVVLVVGRQWPAVRLRHVDELSQFVSEGGPFLQ